MTLLVLDLKLPDFPADAGSGAVSNALAAKIPALGGFILSFALVGRTWLNHHRRFGAITRYDGKLQVINLIVLFFVAFLPVPTSILFEAVGNSPWPPILYAVTISGIFISLNWLWRYAYRAELMDPDIDEPLYRLVSGSTTAVWAVFLLSVPVAVFQPTLAMYLWIAIWPASALLGRFQWRKFTAAQTRLFAAQDGCAKPASPQQ